MPDTIGSSGAATFLLSRFNLYIPTFRDMAKLTPSTYDDWCSRRVYLFRKYTLPSVLKQRNLRQTKWLIYFDVEINAPIADLLEELRAHSFIKCILLDLRGKSVLKDMIDQIRVDLQAQMPLGARYVCTTRLDTDDAISNSFFENVDHHLHRMSIEDYSGSRSALTFPFGAQLHEGVTNAYIYERNPFITLIEPLGEGRDCSNVKSVFSAAHFDIESIAKLYRALTTHPQWLQVVHGTNAANEFRPELPILVDPRLAEWFSLA